MRRSPSRWYTQYGVRFASIAVTLVLTAIAPYSLLSQSRSAIAASNKGALPLDRPRALSQPRPTADEIQAWSDRKLGMFIHFGLYSTLGGIWQDKQIDNGYSEQIMANAPIPLDQYSALASQFNPTHFDPDAIVALAKAAGMKFIVITSKHHDGFNMFHTAQTRYNIVDATPYKHDIVKQLADACARGGMKFGVYYSSIDWHQPGASTYIPGNSNPIPPAQEAFNVAQLKELLSNYGPISEIWFDMGKPTAEQSQHFAQTVHRLQPHTMVSGRVFNYEGDFTVMGDNEVPEFQIDEPWQTPASIFPETWGYRSWQKRDDLQGKIRENIQRLVEVVSRGGNYILNIGPEGDGSVVPYEADVLRGIGDWLKDRGEAIYATTAQPFRKLDFGYATIGRGKVYLFVKDVPSDGVLRLPGLRAGQLNGAYLLGGPSYESFAVTSTKDGASIRIDKDSLAGAGYFPVIALPFSGRLQVTQASTAPDAAGNFLLTPSAADHFFNYNGAGYEAPETLYKLRWSLVAPPGRYRAEVEVKPTHAKARLDLVVDGRRIPLTVPSSAAASVTIKQSIRVAPARFEEAPPVSIELTPLEPFLKGTQLSRGVLTVRLVRER